MTIAENSYDVMHLTQKRIDLLTKGQGAEMLYKRLWHRLDMIDIKDKNIVTEISIRQAKEILLDETKNIQDEIKYELKKLETL